MVDHALWLPFGIVGDHDQEALAGRHRLTRSQDQAFASCTQCFVLRKLDTVSDGHLWKDECGGGVSSFRGPVGLVRLRLEPQGSSVDGTPRPL